MKLSVPFVQLPVAFDAGAMAEEIRALGKGAWKPHPNAFPGNSMLPLIAVEGDPANEGFAGKMRPTAELDRCPYIRQVLASLGATLGRTRLMRLAGQAEVTKHVDRGYYWVERVRVHVPVVTQPGVRFECGDAALNMAAGECWIFDTWRQHRVFNEADEQRIHLVADTVGGSSFWDLVARGRPGRVAKPEWTTHMVSPEPGDVKLICETVNVPAVMSPWELNAHFALLFEDAVQHPQLGALYQLSKRFTRVWLSLWARYGESPEGYSEYREALDQFLAAIKSPAEAVMLSNGARWHNAMLSIIGQTALSAVNADAVGGSEYANGDRG